jgi:2-iminobutanoate/2-iminopropanoate deaminase
MKVPIVTDRAPAAIGPYSQAVRSGRIVCASGQIPLDPAGQLVPGDVKEQTRQVLENLRHVLMAAGCGLEHVVKTTIFLVDLAHFGAVNDVYGQAFPAPYPARSTVQVAALPRGALVEIDAMAVVD